MKPAFSSEPVQREAASVDVTCPACGGAFRVAGEPAGTALPLAVPFARVGRYELKEPLGAGAFGAVWRAWDTELAREVAVKLPRSGAFTDAHEEERVLREVRATAQLQHPQIVDVHDVGRDKHTVYLVADLVHGVSLAQ